MALEDRTTFDVIKHQLGISESEVIKIIRVNMKPSNFIMWRERVHGAKMKHRALAVEFDLADVNAFRQVQPLNRFLK